MPWVSLCVKFWDFWFLISSYSRFTFSSSKVTSSRVDRHCVLLHGFQSTTRTEEHVPLYRLTSRFDFVLKWFQESLFEFPLVILQACPWIVAAVVKQWYFFQYPCVCCLCCSRYSALYWHYLTFLLICPRADTAHKASLFRAKNCTSLFGESILFWSSSISFPVTGLFMSSSGGKKVSFMNLDEKYLDLNLADCDWGFHCFYSTSCKTSHTLCVMPCLLISNGWSFEA